MSETIDRIKSLRAGIRYHRAQVSDYRCWVDDLRLYQLAELPGYLKLEVPPEDEFMLRCKAFWDNRQREYERGTGDCSVDSSQAVQKIRIAQDEDLGRLPEESLKHILTLLLEEIRQHESKGFQGRTVADDLQLYGLLPETEAWTSALPARAFFLSNCAKFCSHCKSHPEHLLEWAEEK